MDEDSEWTEEEIEEAASVTRADIDRAMELIREASPELAEMVEAEAELEADVPDRSVSDDDLLRIETVTFIATYNSIIRVARDPQPHLSYTVHGMERGGQKRRTRESVRVDNDETLARLEAGFEPGGDSNLRER